MNDADKKPPGDSLDHYRAIQNSNRAWRGAVEEDEHKLSRGMITVVTRVTRWGVPETKCTRRYGATLYKLLKNSERISTLSTIFGWERDYSRLNVSQWQELDGILEGDLESMVVNIFVDIV